MSGGIAYVLDEAGDFEDKALFNALVDLDPFDDPADIAFVKGQIQRHVEYTRSPKGQWILEHWDSMRPKFIKIFPQELKAALLKQDQQQTSRR
jgi:glutamate synthase domain-containing protein 3